ncbi:MAG: DUF4250 domain-containing protein [Parasporobacterium sp.]|nr:DUF4250 domain-containing protein [Parasporobacterium sp.]
MTNIPQDPIILYSYLNTMLRDRYPSLADLCEANGLDLEDIVERLKSAGFEYNENTNQFR